MAVHTLAPPADHELAGQAAHNARPGLEENVPSWHGEQAGAPAKEKLPDRQVPHSEAPDAEKRPAVHGVQAEAPLAAEKLPDVQALHADAPDSENVPAEQVVQAVEAAAEKVPPWHWTTMGAPDWASPRKLKMAVTSDAWSSRE